jgi:HlyD family secretion protein
LLYRLDPQPESAQLNEAQETLEQAQARLNDLILGQRNTIINAITSQKQQTIANMELSKRNYERYQELYNKRAVDKATLDNAYYTYQRDVNRVNELTSNLAEAKLGARENLIHAQKAQVDAAQAAVSQAQWRLSQKNIYAPITGLIYDTYYKVGEFVPARSPVVVMLAPKDIKLIFYIPEPSRSELKMGQTIYFDCDSCTQISKAKIEYISPQAEYTPPVIFSRESRYKLVYRVKAALDLAPGIFYYPGQPVDIFLKNPNKSPRRLKVLDLFR